MWDPSKAIEAIFIGACILAIIPFAVMVACFVLVFLVEGFWDLLAMSFLIFVCYVVGKIFI